MYIVYTMTILEVQVSRYRSYFLTEVFKNYWIQIEVSIICRSEAEADNADRSLNNSDILRKPNSIILLLFRIFKFSESFARILKAHSHSHSMSGSSI
jgi:hypothetical protein